MNGEDKIQITMTLNDWNQVLLMLAKQPYEISAGIIQQIQIQGAQAANAEMPGPQPFIPSQVSNGVGG